MRDPKIQQIFGQFAENGIKLLLENHQNVRDLLALTAADFVKMIDLSRLKPIQTAFVQRDCRHGESDVVLVAPLRRTKVKPSPLRLLI